MTGICDEGCKEFIRLIEEPPHKYQENTVDTIVEAINKKDIDLFRSVFSKVASSTIENIDEKISGAFDYFEREVNPIIISQTKSNLNCDTTVKVNYNKTVRESYVIPYPKNLLL